MKKTILITLFLLISLTAEISYATNIRSGLQGDPVMICGADKAGNCQDVDPNGNAKATLGTTLACEDVANDICKVEQRFSYDGNITADKQIKAAPGFVHQLVCIGTDAAATAGTIILYDNTAESGTIIFSWAVQAVAYTQPVVIPLNVSVATGIYLGFTTTADVTCTVSYR